MPIIAPQDPNRPQWSMTLGELLDRAASLNSGRIYLYFRDRKISYQEFRDYSLRAAALFRDMGIGHGERVALFLPNCPEFLYAWMGLSRLGAVCVPINTAYKRDEGAFILNSSGAKLLLAHRTLLDTAREMRELSRTVEGLIAVDGSDGPSEFPALEKGPGTKAPLSPVDEATPRDVSMLVYTSGTTGRPKGVMVTHEMYVAAGQGFAAWVNATSTDRFFTCLPLYHANAQYYSTMGSLASGGSLILEERFSASRFLDQLRQSGATVVNFIGMMLPVLMKQPPGGGSAARVFYGSPAFAAEVLSEFEERFGTRVLIGYALTECCYGTIERPGRERRARSSGQPRWHPDPRFKNEVRILDEGGRPLPAGKTGEVAIRNPTLTPGYWQNEEETRHALRGGWFHTGDLGRMDEDGYLYFVDRKKDVIRRRGENISSLEVEEVLRREARIMDCAVIGVPSELGEEEVKAYVVLRPGVKMKPEEAIHWCAERLAHFKVPRYVEFRSELPMTPSLRVRKELLRREGVDPDNCFDREKAGIRLRQ